MLWFEVHVLVVMIRVMIFSSWTNKWRKSSRFDSIIHFILVRAVSGSMSVGNQMNILRLSFRFMLGNCQAQNCKVSLVSWNTTPEWWTKQNG